MALIDAGCNPEALVRPRDTRTISDISELTGTNIVSQFTLFYFRVRVGGRCPALEVTGAITWLNTNHC